MKKVFSRLVSSVLTTAMLASSLVVTTPVSVLAAGISDAGGWNETIYATLSGVSDGDVTSVSYSGTTSGVLAGEDLEYLVRDYDGGVRIDIPGVPTGTYTLTVGTTSGELTQSNIYVPEQDRSGYAHFNYTEGVGAYNDDGTLKANAKVLYVTDANKDTVTVSSADGTTVTGIGNILNSVGATQKEPGALTNTNQGIIRKLAEDGTPLVVRFIGDVTAPEGLTAYDSADYGGTEGDNGFMARMQGGKDITLEGIGPDATVNGWGFHFIAQTADAAKGFGKSFEVRNISFRNVPEDCVGMEGQQEGSTITAGVERCWVHNCNFYAPSISNPAESDKDGGDGACDFKRGQYFTNSYCYYEGYHKTNLVGSSDDSLQFNLTYHHNYWKNCASRGPLARQANIHMYNNVFEGQTDYCMNPRANAYIFSEYNLFYLCKNPVQVKSGAVKSYNDSFTACIEDNQATIVTDRSQTVSNNCSYGSIDYSKFDTDSSLSYIPSGDYEIQENVIEAKKVVMAYAGTEKENVVTPEEVDTSLLLDDRQPTASVALPYSQNLNSSYVTDKSVTVDNVIFNVAKTDASSVTVGGNTNGQDIVFNVNTAVNITMTDGGASYPVVLMDVNGVEYLTGSGTAYNVPAGTYIIQSSGFQPAKSGEPAKYKESKITYLGIEVYDPEAPTVTEPTTQATTATVEPPSQTTTNDQGGDEPTEDTTEAPPYTGEGLVWDYTSGTNTLNANVDANDWANAEPVVYNGSTFTKAIKMESSTNITFNAPGSGILTLVTYSGKADAAVEINGTSYPVSQNGSVDIPITAAGTVTITKDTTDTYIYVMEFKSNGSGEDTSATTSESTTEATTASTTETTTVTESTTEATTQAPVEGVNIAVADVSGTVGQDISVPVTVEGGIVSGYDVTVRYNTDMLTFVSAEAGNSDSGISFEYNETEPGVIEIAATNANDIETSVLFRLNFTVNSTGSSDISLGFEEIFDPSDADIIPNVDNGTVTVADPSTGTMPGDVDLDKDVDNTDAAILLRHISGIAAITDSAALANADCDGTEGIDMADVIWILNHQSGEVEDTTATESTTETTTTTTESTTETTTESTTEATTSTTTEATTTTESTESTTEAPAGSAYSHNFTTDDTDSTFFNITGNLSTSKGTVNYGGLTLTQCLKMESSTSITFNGAGVLTLVFGSDSAGCTVELDGNEYDIPSGGILEISGITSGSHELTKGSGSSNLFYMVLSGSGSVIEPPTQGTTTDSEETTEGTTGETPDLEGAINIAAGDSTALVNAINDAKAGDVINLAPANYDMSKVLKLDSNGSASAPITLTCTDGMATLDFDGTSGAGTTVSGDYYDISNIKFTNAGDNGMYVTGSHIDITNCVFQSNHDTGLQISKGGNNVLVKNCTSFDNEWAENADGFAAKLGVGENVVFDGCISYNNADDGWDLYSKSGDQMNKAPITIRNCIAFNNGTLTDGTQFSDGDRNGFKLGGSGYSNENVVENCIAFNNGTCGFTDNNNPGLAALRNCTGYANAQIDVKKHNFSVYRASENLEMTNCLSYVLNADPNGGMDRFQGTSSGKQYNANATVTNSVLGSNNKYYLVDSAKITNNTDAATYGTEITINDSMFESVALPYTDLQKVHEQMRNADGSIKLNGFLQPVAGSPIEGIGAQFDN